jgi:hypothetical protein
VDWPPASAGRRHSRWINRNAPNRGRAGRNIA